MCYSLRCNSERAKSLSNVSKIFYDAYKLYKTELDKFYDILKHFYEKYDI